MKLQAGFSFYIYLVEIGMQVYDFLPKFNKDADLTRSCCFDV